MTRSALLVAVSLFAIAGCKSSTSAPGVPGSQGAASTASPSAGGAEVSAAHLGLFKPLPARFDNPKNPWTESKATLGRLLYFDVRLSKSQKLSCNSCHDLLNYGVDGQKTSEGHKGQHGTRNSPSVYNAGGHIAQFWDGRAADLEAQATGPVTNPVEMAMPSPEAVVALLQTVPGYVEGFRAAFPDDKEPLTIDNVGRAIAAFERQLVTPSRFDKLLGGDQGALTDDEKRGLAKFVEVGCATCHNGVGVGGGLYQKLGLVVPWPAPPTGAADLGRYNVTKQEADKQVFRVPSLRNIERTAPYFHDGSVPTLEQAVKLMAKHQLGKELGDGDVSLIVGFLRALTGKLDTFYISRPEMLPGSSATPKGSLD